MNTYQKLGAVLSLVLGGTGVANSAVLFNNITDPITYQDAIALSPAAWAEGAFTTPGSCLPVCSLDKVSLLLRATSAELVNLGLSIWSSQGVANIGSLTSDSGGDFPQSINKSSSFTPASSINLSANTTYWLRLQNLDPIKSIELAYGPYDSGSFTYYDPTEPVGSQINNVPAPLLIKVEGTASSSPVPVPATVWLMGTVLLGLGKSWLKKKS